MPNLASNRFEIAGPKDDLSAFKRTCCYYWDAQELALDIEKIIPFPTDTKLNSHSSSQWRLENWSTSWVNDFETGENSDEKLILFFISAVSPPDNVYQEISRRFPNLMILAECYDEGNEFTYRFKGRNGKFSTSTPRMTKAFTAHVDGLDFEDRKAEAQSFEINLRKNQEDWRKYQDEFFRKQADITPPLTLFGRLFEWIIYPDRYPLSPLRRRRYKRMERALSDYPTYTPPSQKPYSELTRKQSEENFEHFMATKSERLINFSKFMKKFDIPTEYNDDSMTKVSKWCEKWLGYTLPYLKDFRHYYRAVEAPVVPWEGRWKGPNFLIDLGTYVGEWGVQQDTSLRWSIEKRRTSGGNSPIVINDAARVWFVIFGVQHRAGNEARRVAENFGPKGEILDLVPLGDRLRL